MALSIDAVSDSEINTALERLSGWCYAEKAISRMETFTTYLQALDFVQRVGLCAEENNHHPDIIMNFKKVTVRYWTHKIGGVSRGDLIMAEKVSRIIEEMKK